MHKVTRARALLIGALYLSLWARMLMLVSRHPFIKVIRSGTSLLPLCFVKITCSIPLSHGKLVFEVHK
jgi:hypothetical protein